MGVSRGNVCKDQGSETVPMRLCYVLYVDVYRKKKVSGGVDAATAEPGTQPLISDY